MNEELGDTPNPLNPNADGGENSPTKVNIVDESVSSAPLDANPSEPSVAVEGEQMTVESATPDGDVQVESAAVVTETVQSNEVDPLSRPMEQATPTVDSPKPQKKKTGLIIGVIAALLVAVGCGVAAALMLNNSGDAVTKAIQKLMNGDTPTNLAVDGVIEMSTTDTSSLVNGFKINFNSEVATNSMINSTTANLTIDLEGASDVSLEFDEIYAANSDLYFKIDGISEALSDPDILRLLTGSEQEIIETECVEGNGVECLSEQIEVIECENQEGCDIQDISNSIEASGEVEEILGVVESLEGEWLRVSMDDLTQNTSEATNENALSCLVNSVNDVDKNSNSIAQLYKRNSFIYSKTENIPIERKQDPIYEVGIDTEKLTNFLKDINNSKLTENLLGCFGYEYTEISDSDIANIVESVEQLPAVYVEIDGNNNFTRLYFTVDNSPGWTLTTDLSFAYPSNINVSEPIEYEDFSQVIQELFSTTYESAEDEATPSET